MDGERHLEVRVGNVETETGGRQVFGALAKADTDIKVLIHRSLDAVGRTEDTVMTAFTNRCSGLRRILADAGVTEAPVLASAPQSGGAERKLFASPALTGVPRLPHAVRI